MNGDYKHVCTIWQPPKCTEVPPTANFFQKQRCMFRELALPSEWHHASKLFIRSQSRLRRERARHRHLYVCHPYSPLKYYWDCMNLLFTLAVFIYLPLQVFIVCPAPDDWFILFTDGLAILNVCSQFFSGYLDQKHKIAILDLNNIAIHYLNTNFIADCIGSLPLQLIIPFDNCRYPTHTVMFLFKLFRIVTMVKQWRNVIGQLHLSYINYAALKMIVTTIMFFHWMTYIHYQVPMLCYHLYEENDVLKAWLKRFNTWHTETEASTLFLKYTRNFYLVSGLIIRAGYYTPLDSHFKPELLLSSVMGLIGLLFLTYILSALLRLSMYNQFKAYCFRGKLRALEKYMQCLRLPQYLKKKIRSFITYKFDEYYFNEPAILNTIHEQIKQEINVHCCQPLVMNVPMFQDLPIALINSIIFNLRHVLYMPGQTVVEYNKPAQCLYLISSGTVVMLDSSGKEVAHLRDGEFFGENSLLSPGVVQTFIIALEITEVYTLSRAAFQSCVELYPRLAPRFSDAGARARRRRAGGAARPPGGTAD